ncbi:HD domain-containing protein [Candidatus Kaiserbacteria bacterium]|nr:HD domain-containing protein [Candidatus Kaiserbacteria bacterium]
MKEKLPVPKEVLGLCDTLRNAGFEAYLVGGCVRDLLLGREPKDWDITTNATPEQIQKLFAETFYENKFGTVGVVTSSEDPRLKVVEITPYREEGKYSNVRHPDEIHWAKTLSDDLKRRDFTVNALAYEPQSGALADEHGGEDDSRRKLITAVGNPGERFKEDALRMLRAVRLSAELDFTIESKTAASIAADAPLLEKISRERVRDEFIRIIESARPMQAIFVAQKLGLLSNIIPELEAGMGIAQNQAHAYDVFEHNIRSLQHAADKDWPLSVRLAALLHDIGKPAARRWSDEKNDWTFHGHEVVGAKIAKKILRDLRMPGDIAETVVALVRWHMFFSDPDKVTLSAVRRTIRNVGQENIKDLLTLRICDRIGTGRPKEQPFRLRKYMSMVDEALRDPISVSMLAIDGIKIMALGEAPGPRIGWILHALLEEVLDDPKKNTAAHLESRAKELAKLPESELQTLGEAGKERREGEEEAAVQELRKKHHVS